jgi:excisionase family DNA binding protein
MHDAYLRTPEASRYCGLSPRTLEKLRQTGSGPAYCTPRGRRFVVYRRADLDEWLASGRRCVDESGNDRHSMA